MSRKNFEHQLKRQYVLEAAIKLFAENGVENTSMDDIARAADYTRRTLYSYFKSHDDICLLALTGDLSARWLLQQEAMAEKATGLARLLAFGESYFKFSLENPHSTNLQAYWDFKGINPSKIGEETFAAFTALNDELASGLRALFKLGINDGSLRPDLEIDMSLSQYIYSLRTIVNRALSDRYTFASFTPEIYIEHFLDLFSRSIRNQKGTA